MTVLKVSFVGHGPFSPSTEDRGPHPSNKSVCITVSITESFLSAPFGFPTPFLLAVETVSDHATIVTTTRADCHSGYAISNVIIADLALGIGL